LRFLKRNEPSIGLAGFGQDNFPASMGLVEKLRKMGFGFVDVDNDGHGAP
jgi:hypothetical protein